MQCFVFGDKDDHLKKLRKKTSSSILPNDGTVPPYWVTPKLDTYIPGDIVLASYIASVKLFSEFVMREHKELLQTQQ